MLSESIFNQYLLASAILICYHLIKNGIIIIVIIRDIIKSDSIRAICFC